MPSYVSTIPYADLAYGNAYFNDRVQTGPWDKATQAKQLAALKQATRAIDSLNFAGEKHDPAWTNGVPNQPSQFPRGDDVAVPDPVVQACCELALVFLDDVDPNMEIQNLSNAQQGIADAKVVRDTSYVQEHVRYGIPSIQAWFLLLPFMRDTQKPRLAIDRG